MFKNKWLWCAFSAVILIIALIFAFRSCTDKGGDASDLNSDVSVGTENSNSSSQPEESLVPEVSIPEISTDVSEESVPSESSDVTVPQVSQETPPEESAEESVLPEVSVSEPILISLPAIRLPEKPAAPWDGSIASGFEKGSGTVDDPYVISTPSQLAYFRTAVNTGNDFRGQFIKLEADLFITDITSDSPLEWESIGNTKNPFCGTFDGDGHVIFGLYGGGLFGYIRGSVKNLGIADSFVTRGGSIADTASRDFDLTVVPVISYCFVTRSTVAGSGGIASYAGGYEIVNCVNDSTVTGNDDWVGGIIGQCAMCSMKNCFNLGTVQTESFCGGVVGNAFDSTYENCFNVGKITLSSQHGSFAAVSYDARFYNCGVLEGISDTVLYLSDMTPQASVDGIDILTKDQFE